MQPRIRFGGSLAKASIIIGCCVFAWPIIAPSIVLGELVFVPSPLMLFGSIMVMGGALLLRGATYFTLDDDKVVVRALLGPFKRTFPFDSLELVEGKLFAITGGTRKRVPVHRSQANTDDWLQLERYLRATSRGDGP
jgi:hypothetical protein